MKSETSKLVSQRPNSSGMSYKFQRLRERIRQGVANGELKGKLPGERELARQFHVNAKTLSKALTDLAAEGLLHRSIGRGTFVRGSKDEKPATTGRWLVLLDADVDQTLVDNFKSVAPMVESCLDVSAIRPSYLNQFSAVIDMAAATPETFIRNLLVRGIPVVAVGQELRTYSVNGVMLDTMLGASYLTRELALGGHRRFLAVEERRQITIAETIRRTASRYCRDYSVDACSAAEVAQAAEYGATACICDSVRAAKGTMQALERAGISVPQNISVAAIGWTAQDYPCTGYFVDPRQQAAAVAEILSNGQPGRPTTLWLSGTLIDRGTTAPITSHAAETPMPMPEGVKSAVLIAQ
ncbi:MAG: GntR family transcriptional regulator [Tepidisphaeraceae bacterium]|jgi:DNA-binding transcriptional regulator YhcF (GntR family)